MVDLRLGIDYAPAAAAIGNEIWIAWIRTHRLPNMTFAEDLVVRPYDRLGNALASETIVRSRGPGQLMHPKMSLNGTTVLLGFFDTQPNDGAYDYVTCHAARSAIFWGRRARHQ